MEIFSFDAPGTPRPLPWNALSQPGFDPSTGEGVPRITNMLVFNLRDGDNVLAVVLLQSGPTSGSFFRLKRLPE